MTDSQPATQAAATALAWLWVLAGGALTAALAAAVGWWTMQELRERRRRWLSEPEQAADARTRFDALSDRPQGPSDAPGE